MLQSRRRFRLSLGGAAKHELRSEARIASPQDSIHERIVEQVTDIPMSQVMEEVAELVQLFPLELRDRHRGAVGRRSHATGLGACAAGAHRVLGGDVGELSPGGFARAVANS